ncbi:sodium:solute symporter family protein [Faecalispora jeddahensis]|uniref:sodium:solute symporter family protein n=1 Tax=Faecalispora jeddahensis TaxID=1414721 RepID=UPI00189814E2|nr:sodium:solute symporter family protein [Faecalispora jeddahensis]
MNFDKEILYLGCFALYSIVLLIVGKSRTQQQNTLRHFYLGNRQLSLFRSTLTFMGTWISAATILGFTGNVFESGLAPLLYSVVPWFFGAFLLQMISGRLYGYDVLTIPELIGKKYGSKWLQILFALVMMVTYTLYIIIHIKGFGLVASGLFNIPYNVATLMIYLFILYSTFGGYRAVTRIDVAHILLLTVGTASVYLLVVGQAGGFSELFRKAGEVSGYAHGGSVSVNQPGDLFRLFDGEKFTPRMSTTMFFGWGLGLASNPQYMIRMLSAKDKRSARSTVRSALCYLAVFYFALLTIGLGMRVLFPSLAAVTNADDVVVYVLNDRLFTPLNTLFLFAILGACVSVANSQLLLFSTSFAYDVIRPLCPKPPREYTTILLTRLGVLIGGTLSLLFSTHPPASLLSYGGDIWGIFGVIFFPALYGAFLYPKATRQGAWAALLVGLLAIAVFYPLYYSQILPVHPAFPGTVLSSLGFFFTSRLTWKEGAADAPQADL